MHNIIVLLIFVFISACALKAPERIYVPEEKIDVETQQRAEHILEKVIKILKNTTLII